MVLLHMMRRWSLAAQLLAVVHSKPDSRMCQPAYDYCLGKDRVGVTLEYWAKRLFRAVSSDDILCMGAFCVDTWLADATYGGECCQAMEALNTVLRATSSDNLGITESQKLYYYTLMDIYTPETGTVFHTPEWWHTLEDSAVSSIPENPDFVFWELGQPIEYPFWTFVRSAVGGEASQGAYGMVRDELEQNWPSLVEHLKGIYVNEPYKAVQSLKNVLTMLARLNTLQWTVRGKGYPTNLPAVNLSSMYTTNSLERIHIMDTTPVNLSSIASIERGCYHAQVCTQWSGNTCLRAHPTMTLTWCP